MSTKETVPFNYDEVYEYVKAKFEDKGYDTQDGSNSMQLASAMSYLVSMLNVNTAVNINETLLTQVRKRTMALKDARVLGYEIQHITSFQYELTLEFTEPGTYVIEKYTEFKAGDYTYYFMGGDDVLEPTVTVVDDPVSITINVIEGNITQYDDDSTLEYVISSVYDEDTETDIVDYFVDIPFTNVEDDGIEVFLTYYDDEGLLHSQEPWTKSSTFLIDQDTTLDKEFVRIDEIDTSTPRIYFKLGDVGKDLREGTIVQSTILQSSGESGVMSELPTTDLNCTVTNYSLIIEGAEEESISSIKTNAPLFHNSANRCVTKPDYIAFCNRQAAVENTMVWDGHLEYPNVPGNIWFSFLSSNTSRSFTENTIGTNWILDDLSDLENWYLADFDNVFDVLDDYKIPTMQFNHRQPVYFDFNYDVNIVKYTTAKSESERNEDIFNVINNYFIGSSDTEGVETFEYEYFESSLNKRIDTELSDLMGFNIKSSYTINLNNYNVIDEFDYGTQIRFHLGVPYETYITDGVINVDNLPSINTESFTSLGDLVVDYTTSYTENDGNITVYNIKIDEEIVGLYKVNSGVIETIEVILYIEETGISQTDVDNGLTVNVTYPSPNIRFSRNTIPRLREVNFT